MHAESSRAGRVPRRYMGLVIACGAKKKKTRVGVRLRGGVAAEIGAGHLRSCGTRRNECPQTKTDPGGLGAVTQAGLLGLMASPSIVGPHPIDGRVSRASRDPLESSEVKCGVV